MTGHGRDAFIRKRIRMMHHDINQGNARVTLTWIMDIGREGQGWRWYRGMVDLPVRGCG